MAATTASATAGAAFYQPIRRAAALLIAPAVLIVTLVFVIPMSLVIASAFGHAGAGGVVFSLDNFTKIVTDSFYWEVMLRTVRVSAFTTIAALIVGYPAALHLYFSTGRWRRYFLLVAISPLFISVVIRTYGWIVILSPNGALNAIIPGGLPFRLLLTEPGIVIGLVHIYVPFMLLSLNASLSKIDKRLLTAATSLGASNLRAFRDVLVPLSIPGIVAGSTIVFTIAMTAFSTPILLGGARSKTMPYLIYQQVMLMSDWRLGGALALCLLVTTIVLVFVLTRVLRLLSRYAVPA